MLSRPLQARQSNRVQRRPPVFLYNIREGGGEKTARYMLTRVWHRREYIYIIILDVIHKIDTPLLRKWKENFVLPVYIPSRYFISNLKVLMYSNRQLSS